MEQTVSKLTIQGKTELEGRLEYLKTIRMQEISEAIAEARSHGDLSENSEYDAAMDEQARTQHTIEGLERILRDCIVVDESDIDTSTVGIGTTVNIRLMATGEEFTYKIVGSAEANIMDSKISDECAIGRALIGHKLSDVVEVRTPAETIDSYQVINISISK